MSAPNTTIKVCSGVRLDSRYIHTLYFKSANEQRHYFEGKAVKTFSAYSYIRRHWNLKVQATMYEADKWNYLFFLNSGDSQYYYYFINNVEYVNENTVELTLEMDVMQSYAFRYSLLPCFVERQHTETDEIGDNTVEESLDLGNVVINNSYDVDLKDLYIMIMSSVDLIEAHESKYAMYSGVYSGLKIWAVDAANAPAVEALDDAIHNANITNGIVAIWMYPKELVTLKWDDLYINEVSGINNFNMNYERMTTINGYTPRNNKLFTHPFNFLYVTNNHGNGAVYRFEKFENGQSANFRVTGALSPEGVCMMYPLFYNGETLNYEEGITLGGFPNCSWTGDTYKLWLAQNQNQQNLAIGSAVVTTVAGIGVAAATGGVGAAVGVGAVLSGASQISSILAQRKDMQAQPPQAKGNQSGSVGIVNGKQTFSAQWKSVSAEQARIIDDYFDLYGYKINRVQVPNIQARNFYTYVKTVGCAIEGELCNEDIVKIESIFDNGITFWRQGDNVTGNEPGSYFLADVNRPYNPS